MTIIGIVLARNVFAVHNVALNEKMFLVNPRRAHAVLPALIVLLPP